MKLSIFKKIALLLVGLSAVQGYADIVQYVIDESESVKTYYNKLADQYCVNSSCIYKGSPELFDILEFSFDESTNRLRINDNNSTLHDGIERKYTIHAFRKTDETTFWSSFNAFSYSYSDVVDYGVVHIDYGFFNAATKVKSESTFLSSVSFSGNGSGIKEFDLTDFIESLRKFHYKDVRIALGDLQYYSVDYGLYRDYDKVASGKTSGARDNVTYAAFVDVALFPYAELKYEKAYSIAPHTSIEISADVIVYGNATCVLQKKSLDDLSWDDYKTQNIQYKAGYAENTKISYSLNWEAGPSSTYRWVVYDTDGKIQVQSEDIIVENQVPELNVESSPGGKIVTKWAGKNVLLLTALPDNFNKIVFKGWENDVGMISSYKEEIQYGMEFVTNSYYLKATFADVDTLKEWNGVTYHLNASLVAPVSGGAKTIPEVATSGYEVYDVKWMYPEKLCSVEDYKSENGSCGGQIWDDSETTVRDSPFWICRFRVRSKDESLKKLSEFPKSKVFVNGEEAKVISISSRGAFVEFVVDAVENPAKIQLTATYAVGGDVELVSTNAASCVSIKKNILWANCSSFAESGNCKIGEMIYVYDPGYWLPMAGPQDWVSESVDVDLKVGKSYQLSYTFDRDFNKCTEAEFVNALTLVMKQDEIPVYINGSKVGTVGTVLTHSPYFNFTLKSQYTITFFDDKGVQVGDVVTVASGMAVSAPAEPAKREGYTFAGWFQKDAETAYDFSAAVNEDLELYGKWTVNKYEIAVSANDSKMGSVKGAGTYEYGTEVELVATAAEGYKFSNWEDDAKASASRKVVVKADAEYTANFSVIPSEVEGSSSSKTDANSSSSEAATNSSSSRNDTEKSSSSSAKPSSSSSAKDDKSSSSSKTDAVVAAAAVPQFSLSVAGRNVQIAGARIGSAYAVLDMQGRVLATGRTASASMEIAVPRAGSYMVRVGSQTKRVNVK